MASNNFKWFTIGFISAVAIAAVVVTVLIYSFTPLIKVDETTGRVQLFGGAIDVRAKNVITKLSKDNSFVFGSIEGAEVLPDDVAGTVIKFGTGEIRIDYNNTREINWDCDGAGKNAKLDFSQKGLVNLDFSAAFVDCDISVPYQPLKIEGNSGEINVRKVRAELDIKLGQGDVLLEPLPAAAYIYDFKTGSGSVDPELKSADATAASPIKVKVDIKVGDISQLD